MNHTLTTRNCEWFSAWADRSQRWRITIWPGCCPYLNDLWTSKYFFIRCARSFFTAIYKYTTSTHNTENWSQKREPRTVSSLLVACCRRACGQPAPSLPAPFAPKPSLAASRAQARRRTAATTRASRDTCPRELPEMKTSRSHLVR